MKCTTDGRKCQEISARAGIMKLAQGFPSRGKEGNPCAAAACCRMRTECVGNRCFPDMLGIVTAVNDRLWLQPS